MLGGVWLVVISSSPVLRFITAAVEPRVVWAVISLVVISAVLGRLARPAGGSWWVVAALLTVVAGIASGQHSDGLESIKAAVALAVLVGVLPYVLRYHVVHERGWLRNTVIGFVAVQTVSAVAGILQVELGVAFLGFEANRGRANGLAGHPNVLGIMATFAIVVCLFVVLQRSARHRGIAAVAGLVNVAALIATGSLSTMISLGVAVVALLLASRSAIRSVLFVVLGGAVLMPVASLLGLRVDELTAGIEHRVDVVTGEAEGVASLDIRQQTWEAGWRAIQADPIIGAGMDPTNQAVYGSTVVHNYLIHYWYQGGFALFVTGLLVTGVIAWLVVRAIVRGVDAVPAAVMAGMLVFALTSAFYDQQYYWLPLVTAIAACPPTLRNGAAQTQTREGEAR